MGTKHCCQLFAGDSHPFPHMFCKVAIGKASLCLNPAQLTGLKIFQNGVAGVDIVAPLANGFMITSCFAFENNMSIPEDTHSLVANNMFK